MHLPHARVRLKIGCITNVEDAGLAVAHGADAIGLMGPTASGRGVFDNEHILEVARTVPTPVSTWLSTAFTSANDIVEHTLACGVNTVQIASAIDPSVYEELRLDLPASARIVQSVYLNDEYAAEIAQEYSACADALFLHTGSRLMGTSHNGDRLSDWERSRHIVDRVSIPVFLAGGLTVANVVEAIRIVRPFGVDVSSCVRTDDRLDPRKLAEFTAAIACS